MKTCRKCGKTKNKKGFFTDNVCKICGERYPKRLVRVLYGSQVVASRARGLPAPTYTYKELISWILAQPNFRELYTAWVKSKYDKMLRPSVDRIKEWESYSLDNIQLMTWAENKAKGELDCKEGRRYYAVKPVCSFDLKTDELAEQYISAHHAQRVLGIRHNTIASATAQSRLKNGRVLGKGSDFKWMFTLDFITNTLQDIAGKERNLQLEDIHFSQIKYNEDTCLVSII